ncbi:MAG: helix-hairpin-helix domain-containing protein [Bacteroidales bacterium]
MEIYTIFKNILIELFRYTRNERTGIIGFLFIIGTLVLVAEIYSFYKREQQFQILSSFDKITVFPQTKHYTPKSKHQKKPITYNFSPFNPNEVTFQELLDMGFTEFQARNVDNFRKKGGRFKEKEDLKKIYGISSAMYDTLRHYIVLPAPNRVKNISIGSKSQNIPEIKPIDINTADTTTFKTLKGIGSVLALRIIKYRERLGGFYSVKQLREVWGIDTVLYKKIEPFLFIDSIPIQKSSLYTSEFKELMKHPYLGYDNTVSIKNCLRKIKEPENKTLHVIFKQNCIDTVLYEKIRPYFY